jgi:hypothetical protein
MNLLSTAAILCLTCVPATGDRAPPLTVDDVLKARGLPLFAAQSARVEVVRQNRAAGPCGAPVSRLVTTDFRVIDSEQEARRLTNAVLIYCTESGERMAWGDLALWASVPSRMAQASPQLGYQGPLPLASPIRIALAQVDRRGRIWRTETHTVTELVHGTGPKPQPAKGVH